MGVINTMPVQMFGFLLRFAQQMLRPGMLPRRQRHNQKLGHIYVHVTMLQLRCILSLPPVNCNAYGDMLHRWWHTHTPCIHAHEATDEELQAAAPTSAKRKVQEIPAAAKSMCKPSAKAKPSPKKAASSPSPAKPSPNPGPTKRIKGKQPDPDPQKVIQDLMEAHVALLTSN